MRPGDITVHAGEVALEGALSIPERAEGVVLFAHGSGSSRFSPRNRFVATFLNEGRLGTLLLDLLQDRSPLGQARVHAFMQNKGPWLRLDGDRPFDLIISAQAMPGLPGVSVLAGLRSRGRRTPFVLLTGHPVVQAQARRLGAVVLDRPFDAATIRRALVQAEELVANRG